MLSPWRLLIWQLAVRLSYHVVTASLCLGGSDIFATIRENSPMGQLIANLSIAGDPGGNRIRLCLSGENVDWFFLEGRTIRLNASASKMLDREVLGSILLAVLTCYEDDVKQSQYRIMVEILNENDNKPHFLQDTVRPFYISELAAVNSVVFTVRAVDADGDIISYIIDESLPDASYFRIDLPNSGNVVLDKPLDYETKTQLKLVIYATESNTREKYNTTTTLTLNIMDGDDQYPQFLPCTPASPDVNLPVCTNPVYTANITEKDIQDMILDFSPGPIHAEDGDRSLDTPLAYTVLSGADHGRFVIDSRTGEITLTRPVNNRQETPTFTLRIMASQLNDPMKYSVTTALVRVLAKNNFPPAFNRTTYKGFVVQSSSPAAIISTFGNQVLLIQATDNDFSNDVNPNIHYTLHPPSVSELYHITQDGVLIARTDHLRAFDRHILEVVARDEESGETTTASVDIEILQSWQPVPRGPIAEEQMFGDMETKLAGGITTVILLLFVVVLVLLFRMIRRRRGRRQPADGGAVALGTQPNVVNLNRPLYLPEELSYYNEVLASEYDPSHSAGPLGRQGVYTRRLSLPPPPSRVSGSVQETDFLPEPQPGDFTSSHQSRTPEEIGVMFRKLEGMKHTAAAEIECVPTVKEELPLVRGRTEGLSTDIGAKVQGDGSRRRTIEKPRGIGMKREKKKDDTRSEAENPYHSMHAVICSSEDNTSTEDELRDS